MHDMSICHKAVHDITWFSSTHVHFAMQEQKATKTYSNSQFLLPPNCYGGNHIPNLNMSLESLLSSNNAILNHITGWSTDEL